MIWNWDIDVPGNKEFVAAYKAAQPNAPYPPANEMLGGGFAMGRIIGQTLEKAGSRDPAKLRDVLAATEFTNLPLPATKIKFGSNGLNEYGTGVLAEWIKGEIRTVWPKENQAIQPMF